jgi:hypothetical protein
MALRSLPRFVCSLLPCVPASLFTVAPVLLLKRAVVFGAGARNSDDTVTQRGRSRGIGWAAVLDQILKLDFDVVAPGSGPVMSRAAFEDSQCVCGIAVLPPVGGGE